MNVQDRNAGIAWCGLVLCCVCWGAWTRPPHSGPHIFDPAIGYVDVTVASEGILLDAADAGEIHFTLDGSAPDRNDPIANGRTIRMPDTRRSERLMRHRTSIQQRDPLIGLPSAQVLRAAQWIGGAHGPVRTRTVPVRHHTLPIVALTADAGAFFDPDSGIYVIGNAIFRSDGIPVRTFPKDHRWWKYPGNFQMRGEEWERSVYVEALGADGTPLWDGDARARIHGNNTRGFPQHALRITLPEPCAYAWTSGTAGQKSVILRAAGNDQADSFMRDLVQHRMCTGLPFVTTGGRSVVMYLNGAYWGVHHVRDRMDNNELARRYGGSAKRYTVLEDRLKLYKGDEAQIKHFSRFLTWSERWDASAPAFVDSVSRYLDVDGFLAYMAAQLILGNMDWPDQNVRYWRWTGVADTVPGPHDGRWHMMMGDSDMGLGYSAPVTTDPFAHVERHNGPIARLFKAMMRSDGLRERMLAEVERLLAGPLSTGGMLTVIDEARAQLAPEMADHVARWRKPATVAEWERNVEVLRTFARDRPAAMHAYAATHLSVH